VFLIPALKSSSVASAINGSYPLGRELAALLLACFNWRYVQDIIMANYVRKRITDKSEDLCRLAQLS